MPQPPPQYGEPFGNQRVRMPDEGYAEPETEPETRDSDSESETGDGGAGDPNDLDGMDDMDDMDDLLEFLSLEPDEGAGGLEDLEPELEPVGGEEGLVEQDYEEGEEPYPAIILPDMLP